MKFDKIRALILLTIVAFLVEINLYVADYYKESVISLGSMLIVMFVYCPAIIASLYVLTDGWILRAFLGPTDYGYWGK